MGQGRADPFSTFARPITTTENFFIDHYIGSSMSYYKLQHGTRFHPPRDICFAVGMTEDAALCAMIAYSAKNIGVYSTKVPTEALTYRGHSIRLINKNLSDPEKQFSDGNLVAVVGAIAYDKETTSHGQEVPETSDLETHIQGLRQMIIARGGFGVIAKEAALSWLIHWMDVLNAGSLSAGLIRLSTHAFCAPARLNIAEATASTAHRILWPHRDDLRPVAEEFIGAYGNFYREAQSRAAAALMATLDPATSSHLLIHQIFRRGTPIHRLLHDPNTTVAVSPCGAPFFLNIILWDGRATPTLLVSRYFKQVRLAMVDEGLDIGGVVEVLLWVLMTDPNHRTVADPEQMWLLARLLRVEKILGRVMRMRLRRALLSFLTAGDASEQIMDWAPEVFRQDVLAELGLADEGRS